MQKFIKVVLNLNIFSEFIYKVPTKISKEDLLYRRVYIPFKKKITIGFVIDGFEENEDNFPFKIEEIIDIVDKIPLISQKEFHFYKWLSNYYITPLGQIIFNALPSFSIDSLKVKVEKNFDKSLLENEIEKKIVDEISKGISLKKLQKNIPFFMVYLNSLEKKGIIKFSKKRYRLTKSDFTFSDFDIGYKYYKPEKLNKYQEDVWNKLKNFLKNEFSVHLIFGITGSGKTEIYLRAIEKVLNMGKQIIFLVPEIALTPNLAEIFFQNFPNKKIVIIHSKITANKKNKIWEEIANNSVDIVIGARSAIFSPLKNLGLIVVDEEHEVSYKQEEKPRYHARDCAVVKGKIFQIPVILGSASPSIKSWYNAVNGKYHFYKIPKRANLTPLPKIEIIDLKDEAGDKIISEKLKKEVEYTIKNKEQVILFLNKKGYANYLYCERCGFIFKCKNCEISLTYYKSKNALFCPYCENYYSITFTCPECSYPYLKLSGKGTEKIEEKVIQEFPGVRVSRFDLESTSKKGEMTNILKKFNKGEIDIIVGTQMIAKGHDFKNVNLVGIITIDNVLNFPDYTSSERAFQLLVQCSGRAGRNKKQGKVVIQSFNPDNYVFKFFEKYNFEGFYNQELEFRKQAKYPPFYNLVHIIFEGNNKEKVKKNAKKIFDIIVNFDIIKLGPVESPIKKIRNKFRYSILLKAKSKSVLNKTVKKILNKKLDSGVDIKIDIDPENIT